MLEGKEMARRLGVPRRYVDVVLAQGHVPYALLFEHVRQGGALRRDAMIELRKRAPAPVHIWIGDIQKSGRWSDLLRCQVPRGSDEDTEMKFLEFTLAWLKSADPDGGTTSGFKP
jgi:hypothetical protein